MPINDPRDNYSRPVAPGSMFHTFLPQEKAAEEIFGPASVPLQMRDAAPLQGCQLATAMAADDASTIQDMVKELRHRLQPVLRDPVPEPTVNQSYDTEKKPMSPMAQEIRGISSCLGVSKHIINDILARLEV
jgi:hypothetical protein